MGGVDLFDNALNNYRIHVRGKKWYWPLVTNALDAAIVNAWKLLHCICRKFEKSAESLLRSAKIPVKKANLDRNKGLSASNVIRADRVDHIVVRVTSRRRFRHCHNGTVYECKKCKASLHPKCFDSFHK